MAATTANMPSMQHPGQPESPESSPLVTAHSLAILSEYTHTLDALPLNLSRNFADLRELDAVLSSSMSSVTSKITQLTDMLEKKAVPPEDRLWLLADIADEVSRLKPGADDKIRVACHAADALKGHKAHMTSLLEAMPDEEFGKTADRVGRKTKYPWVTDKLYGITTHPGESSRSRNRKTQAGGHANDSSSPNKRKRVAVDGDDDVVHRSPRKDRMGDGRRNGARRKVERVASPTESLASVASQPQISQPNARQTNPNRAANGNNPHKRARGQATAVADDPPSFAEFLPPSTSHPSLPPPFSRNANGARDVASEWPAGQLEGPGMPVARSFPSTPVQVNEPENDNTVVPVEGDPEGDDTPYCFCHRASFGQMIACDGVGCAVEWYHLECVGLKLPPAGSWICDDCQKKANAKRGGRGKRRAGGGRSGARNTT